MVGWVFIFTAQQMMKERREGLWFFGLCLTFMIADQAKVGVYRHEFILVSNNKLNWTEAQTFCRFHDYEDLASILDSNTHQLVKDRTSGKDVFWIGLFSEDRSWRWSLLDPRLQQTYRHWDKTQTNRKGEDQNCVTMNDDGFWSVEQCLTTEKAFVCSRSGTKHPYVLVNQRRSWFSAQSFCRRNHRDLVTVASDEENQALLSLMEEKDVGQIWIGLHRPEWEWSDGGVYQFSSWSQKQDKLNGNRRECVAMADGEWRERNCSKHLDFLCKRTIEVELPPKDEIGVFQTSVRMRMKIRTQADLNDPAVSLAVSQQLKAALALHSDAHVSLVAVKAEPRQKERDTCGQEVTSTLD